MTIDNAERPGQRGVDYVVHSSLAVQTDTAADFTAADLFNAIALGQEDIVRNFVEKYPETSNTPNEHGETPLIAAVRVNEPEIVRHLLWNGAKVDVLGNYSQGGQSCEIMRTALQVAAAEGKLDIIRILRENRADVFLYAPDGANALQLAAANNHQSVVEHIQKAYAGNIGRSLVTRSDSKLDDHTDITEVHPVPAQRVQERNERNLDCITWAIPKFILDKTPTTVISAINNVLVDRPKEVRLLRKNVKAWCQEQIQDFPARLQKGLDLVDRETKDALGLATKIPERTGQLMKRAPNAFWTIMMYIGTLFSKIGSIAPYLLKQITAIVQTIAKAMATVQAATISSIKGIMSSIRSVFTQVFKGLLALVARLKQAKCAMLETGMSSLNKIIMIFAALALGLCILFSKRTGGLLQAPANLAKKGVQEMLGLMGPKMM
ncbi:hypothetical protein HDV63DRAFT_262168 [Trichoderma sp. SZMC 28014]